MPLSKRFGKLPPYAWVPSLYFAEGLPYVAVMTISIVMYKRLGLSNADITFYTSWLYLPWVIKPLWSPFVDIIRTKRLWITAMQLLIGAALGGVAMTLPCAHWLQWTLCLFWLMAFASATHDIAADGFYMLSLDEARQSFYVGVRSLFYRLATIFGQGFLIALAGNLETITRNVRQSWSLTFYFTAGLFLALWLWHSAALPHPSADSDRHTTARSLASDLWTAISTFFAKPQVATALCFMLFYRMPEGLLAKVSPLFLIDRQTNGGLGLSTAELGFAQGTVGIIGLVIGGLLGGMAVSRHGLRRWLWPMVLAITLPDLVYVFLAYALPANLWVTSACIFVEQFGYGFGFTAYMLYLIYYSQGDHKTSHYALSTAFMALSMMIPGLFAGALQEAVGYRAFFIVVAAACTVTYAVAARLKIDPTFGAKRQNK